MAGTPSFRLGYPTPASFKQISHRKFSAAEMDIFVERLHARHLSNSFGGYFINKILINME